MSLTQTSKKARSEIRKPRPRKRKKAVRAGKAVEKWRGMTDQNNTESCIVTAKGGETAREKILEEKRTAGRSAFSKKDGHGDFMRRTT